MDIFGVPNDKIKVLVYATKRSSSSLTKFQGKITQKQPRVQQWTCNTAGFDSDLQCWVLVSQKANIDSEYLLQSQKLNHMVGRAKGEVEAICKWKTVCIIQAITLLAFIEQCPSVWESITSTAPVWQDE